MVAHSTTDMAIVKQRGKRFGTGITRINGTSNMEQKKFITGMPFLDGKMLDINMARTGSRAAVINHSNGSLIIHIHGRRTIRRETKLCQNGAKVFDKFGSRDRSYEFGFSAGCSNSALKFGFVGNHSTRIEDIDTGDRATGGSICGMGSIQKTNKVQALGREGR